MGTPARVVVLPADTAKLRVESLELPDPAPHQVVVKQFASGICHSQLHQMHGPRKTPVILGHESTGVVLHVGSDFTNVTTGETVMVTWVPRQTAESIPPVAASLTVMDGVADPKTSLPGQTTPSPTNSMW